MAGRRRLLRRRRVRSTPPIATSGSVFILPSPSVRRLSPNPSMMPRRTGLVVILSIQRIAPVIPINNQKRPVKIPDPQIIPGVMTPDRAIAMFPMAFMGWTGMGVLKNKAQPRF